VLTLSLIGSLGTSAAAEQLYPPVNSAPPPPGLIDPTTGPDQAQVTETPTSNLSSLRFPAFDITPDGIVVRARSSEPRLETPAIARPGIIQAPYHSQFDGSLWAETNCGPATLAMALGALGITVDQIALRALANRQMGSNNPGNGTTWESLAYAASQNGASTDGLMNGRAYRKWTLDDLRQELNQGRPVMILVRYWDLPYTAGTSFAGDHYILALGFNSQGDLVYNDSAVRRGSGANRTIRPGQLLKAWQEPASGQAWSAMAFYR
jgi:hypothetical protein